ncbi:patatin-like phospholipase family protein [Flavisolibacter ginsenosidimutans]|uniref:Patatin-like phospholipase family protein n=1 Tax=Flavisolibacter ginsenosidimutans TaxID=661481 RepID=A0A5B8UKP9_9BACT|nr:patatin-like phospholipase family protein [Flavisolibacter ginsenosidimutans]QEC57254.1 patatin-like phospholipase family protein [Flavisolibacter ginsenosidimutans]
MEYFSFLPRSLQKNFRSTLQPLKQSATIIEYLRGTFYSLPVQLLFLHFRKYQVLLVFWLILFSVVGGVFMKSFGAEALYLAPEYMGNVNALGAAIVGVAIGIFIMCWNVTTFILFSRHFSFLAATQYPFLKYCVNNSIIPLSFLVFYLLKAYQYAHYKELIANVEIVFLTGGFLIGLLLVFIVSFLYFFSADRTIFKILQPLFSSAKNYISTLQPEKASGRSLIYSEWFLDSFFKVRRCRDVSHYSPELMEKIFKRHHFAAVISVFIIYLFLLLIGYFIDQPFFQLPAGASITLLFAVLIGVTGAIVYFFQSWSVPVLILFIFMLNYLYRIEWIDPRNKAYGLNYNNKNDYPSYTQPVLDSIAASAAAENDKRNMETVLGRWKAKQGEEKPLLVIVTTSGGGTRSATFTMDVLQRLDSITGGRMMKKTFLFTGASGGMIGASYFRELYRQRLNNPSIRLQDERYVDNIASDLLNPTFTSFVTRDVFAPERKFSVGPYSYLRDRGLAFEEALNKNTERVLDKKLGDYVTDETQANIPLMLYHTLITRDGKKMLIGTQPVRFMTHPSVDSTEKATADAIDFTSFFSKQDPYNLRMLTVLRMNATFPVVLPNVWMPSDPVIDVMDGGLRDNYGVETSLRFLTHMQGWIEQNTRGVVLVQIRDRMDGGWDNPYEFDDLVQNATKPFFLLQHNWYKMMEYFQKDMATYFLNNQRYPVHNITFQYIPRQEEHKAALSFHLTKLEKADIKGSLQSDHNQESFKRVLELFAGKEKKQPK